jgi:short chain dehydrogenase
MDWRPTSPPRQDGRIFAVTGGNAGIGYFISEQLASTGATVVILGRNLDKVATAMRAIRTRVPSADVVPLRLDLADLASVKDAATQLAGLGRLDGPLPRDPRQPSLREDSPAAWRHPITWCSAAPIPDRGYRDLRLT